MPLAIPIALNGLRSGKESQAEGRKQLHLYRGLARFVAPHRVAIEEQVLEGERIFIEDADVAVELQKALESEGMRFILNAHTTRDGRSQAVGMNRGTMVECRGRTIDGARHRLCTRNTSGMA